MTIKLTADQWELYTVAMACGAAARSLNAIANKALKDICKDAPTVGMEQAYNTHIAVAEKSFCKFSKYGATDTEPMYHLRRVIRKALSLPQNDW